jgi:hypothetical protein
MRALVAIAILFASCTCRDCKIKTLTNNGTNPSTIHYTDIGELCGKDLKEAYSHFPNRLDTNGVLIIQWLICE